MDSGNLRQYTFGKPKLNFLKIILLFLQIAWIHTRANSLWPTHWWGMRSVVRKMSLLQQLQYECLPYSCYLCCKARDSFELLISAIFKQMVWNPGRSGCRCWNTFKETNSPRKKTYEINNLYKCEKKPGRLYIINSKIKYKHLSPCLCNSKL